MGGDDYVTKPFRLQELLSRIRSVLRRRQDRQDDVIRIRELRVDLRQAKVFRNGQEVYLSAMEYQLFLFFLHHPDRSSPARSCWMRCGTTKGSMWRTTRFPSR